MKCSIIIPHRGDAGLLWATIHSCYEDLLGVDGQPSHPFEFVVVSNGEPRDDAKLTDTSQLFKFMSFTQVNVPLKRVHSDDPLSPPVARMRGAAAADGDLLFFFDNHCLPGKRYFDRAVAQMQTGKMDMLHSSTKFWCSQEAHYHYRLRLEYNFWGDTGHIPQDAYRPYQLAMGGHGGFVVKKSVWDDVGGYGPENLLDGYGGEEPLFDLKMWRLGKNNWIDPKLIHWHYPGSRPYARHFSDPYYTNMLSAALVIGGEDWLWKVFNSFLTKSHLRCVQTSTKTKWQILENAYERSIAYAKELDSKSVRSLDECLRYFVENQVAR